MSDASSVSVVLPAIKSCLEIASIVIRCWSIEP
jgi:hypothetical protein